MRGWIARGWNRGAGVAVGGLVLGSAPMVAQPMCERGMDRDRPEAETTRSEGQAS